MEENFYISNFVIWRWGKGIKGKLVNRYEGKISGVVVRKVRSERWSVRKDRYCFSFGYYFLLLWSLIFSKCFIKVC